MCKSPGLLCSSKLEDNKALEVVASFPSTAVLLPASLLPSLLGLQRQVCKRFVWRAEAQPELCGVGVQQCTGMLNAVFHTLSAAFWCIHWKKKKKIGFHSMGNKLQDKLRALHSQGSSTLPATVHHRSIWHHPSLLSSSSGCFTKAAPLSSHCSCCGRGWGCFEASGRPLSSGQRGSHLLD